MEKHGILKRASGVLSVVGPSEFLASGSMLWTVWISDRIQTTWKDFGRRESIETLSLILRNSQVSWTTTLPSPPYLLTLLTYHCPPFHDYLPRYRDTVQFFLKARKEESQPSPLLSTQQRSRWSSNSDYFTIGPRTAGSEPVLVELS